MKRVFGFLFALAVVTGSASFAAQDQPPPPPPGGFGGGGPQRMQFQMPTFAELDKNKDKKISKDEFPSQFPPQMFDRLDANHDGFIDEAEWNAMQAPFGGGPGGRGPRPGEPPATMTD